MPFLKRIPLAVILALILLLFPVIGVLTWSLKMERRKEWVANKQHEDQVAIQKIRAELQTKPNDRVTVLKLASALYAQGAYDEIPALLEKAAEDNTNWTAESEGQVMYDYCNDLTAVMAFLEVRRRHEPTVSQLPYLIAGCESQLELKQAALDDLKEAIKLGGEAARSSAVIDPRFSNIASDPAFKAMTHPPR